MWVEEAINAIAAWGREIKAQKLAQGVYIFGSLINDGGAQLDPQTSDIDVVVVMPDDDAILAVQRAKLCRTLQHQALQLEKKLFFSFRRNSAQMPILSINLVTRWEAEGAMHKDREATVFRDASFKEVDSIEGPLIALARIKDDGLLMMNSDLLSIVGFVQEVRNKYLRTNVHEVKYLIVDPQNDPLPKQFLRQAAKAMFRRRNGYVPAAGPMRTDTAEGLELITLLLNERRDESAEIEELRKWFAVQREARGADIPLDRERMLLVAEVLFDATQQLFRLSPVASVIEAIGKFGGADD